MICPNAGEILSAYLDRELPAGEQAVMGRHLEICESCQAGLHALVQAKVLVRQQSGPGMPPDLRAAIEARTLQREPAPRPRAPIWTRPLPLWTPAAVGLAAALGTFLLLRWYQALQPAEPPVVAQVRPRLHPAPRIALHHEPSDGSGACENAPGC